MYACPPMPPPLCPPKCPPSKPTYDPSAKYYREIGTAMVGNQLIIRMEREKGRSKKSKGWDPPCDCDVVEIQRPTGKQGPKILKGADNNRILFRVESKASLTKKNNQESLPQGISYEVGQCRGGSKTNNQCRTITIYPIMDGSGAQEVHTDRVTEGNENVFMVKVKKKSDSEEQPRRNVELELRTPKCPLASSSPPPEEPEKQEVSGQTAIKENCIEQIRPKKAPRKAKKKKRKK